MEQVKKKGFLSAEIDMTKGNLFLKLMWYALPIFFTTILQLLYSTVDLISVQKWGGGDTSMGSIAANGSLINLIIVVFSNMALGANVCIANARGANDPEKANKVLHTSLVFSLYSGIFVGLVGFFLSDNLLRLMGTESAYLDLATIYLKIYFIGLPFLMVYNYAAQALRAIGNSKTPFFILFISGIINIVFDYFFVRYFHMDVVGVAVATIISEGISAVLAILYLFLNKDGYLSLKWKELKIDKQQLKEIVKIGLPAGLQGFFFALPNVFIQAKLYTIEPGNVNLSNGAIASGQLEGYIFAGVAAISSGTMSFTSTNLGALNKKNIVKVFFFSHILNILYNFIVSIVVLTSYKELLSLFVSNSDAIEYGKQRLFVIGLTYVLDGAMDVSASSLRGVKHSTYPMIVTLVFCSLLRIIFVETLFNLSIFHTVSWLYAIFPISWIFCIIFNAIGVIVIFKRIFKEIDNNSNLELKMA